MLFVAETAFRNERVKLQLFSNLSSFLGYQSKVYFFLFIIRSDRFRRRDDIRNIISSADGNYEVRYKSNVLIYPNGEVLWVPPAIYQSSCTIDVTYFPFDQQTCIMKFGSWTFNGDQVSLALYNDKNFVDLSDYWKSGTWDIISVPAYLNTYQGDFPTETDITFYIIIRR